jgi:transposase
MVGSRTRLICQMRAFCLEYGIAIRQGAGLFKLDLPRVLATESNDLSPTMRRLVNELFEDLMRLEKRIAEVTHEIEALAAKDEKARRLMTIPGIGPLGATALLAAAGDSRQFKKARNMAAWLGLVPQQYSTGGKPQMLGISKRGNRYLRRLLIHGARSMRHAPPSIARPLGGMAPAITVEDARQQGHRCPGGQNCSHRLGDTEPACCGLRAARSCARIGGQATDCEARGG